MKKKTLVITIIIIVIVLIICGVLWRWQQRTHINDTLLLDTNNTKNKEAVTNTEILNTKDIKNEETTTDTGIIEGSLSYPSEVIPDALKVCAENITTQKEYCTNNHIIDKKYIYHKGYKLEVPVGKYLVFSQREGKDKKAYYSEFVICGLKVNCPSHNAIVVNVNSGQITSEVDPHDWYTQN